MNPYTLRLVANMKGAVHNVDVVSQVHKKYPT